MNIQVFENYESLSNAVCRFIIDIVKEKPDALLCIAAGSTPLGALSMLVKAAGMGQVDFSRARFVGLDEWAGLGGRDEGSCLETLQTHFFGPLGIPEERLHFFNGKNPDLQEEALQMDQMLREQGPIDFMLLGLGVNGHLGFNEPGVSFDLTSHVIDLDPVTTTVGQKYFKEEKQLTKGITLGIRHILNAGTVLLAASGSNKAEAVQRMIAEEISPKLPASALRLHRNSSIFLDREASQNLSSSAGVDTEVS